MTACQKVLKILFPLLSMVSLEKAGQLCICYELSLLLDECQHDNFSTFKLRRVKEKTTDLMYVVCENISLPKN